MSLQIWLPLNGDLNNQGLSNVTITNNGATVDEAGKIGKCYSFGTNKVLSKTDFSLDTSKDYSFACWFYLTSQTSVNSRLIQVSDSSNAYASVAAGLAIDYNNSGTQGKFMMLDGNGASYYNYDFALNTWYHVAMTKQGQQKKLYLNGTLLTTATFGGTSRSSKILAIGNSIVGDRPVLGKMNDVRIYDSCLPPEKVAELAKGLVLHYHLTGPGQENLAKNTADLTKWTKETGVSCIEENGWFKVSDSTHTSSRWGIYQDVPVKKNTDYIVSGLFKSGSRVAHLGGGPGASYGSEIKQSSSDGKPNFISSIINSGDKEIIRIYLNLYPTELNQYCYFKNIKLEEGSIPTPWMPNPADDAYSTMGYDNGIEYDCSGFKHNGTRTNGIKVSSNTPRGRSSYYFDGTSSSLISIPHKLIPELTNATFSMWFYRSEYGSDNWESLFSIYNDAVDGVNNFFEIESKNNSTNAPYIRVYNGPGTNITKADAYKLNTWNHLAVTVDSSNIKLYINGDLVGTGTSQTMSSRSTAYIGNYAGNQKFKGYMSDVRVYATVLSDTEIKKLSDDRNK